MSFVDTMWTQLGLQGKAYRADFAPSKYEGWRPEGPKHVAVTVSYAQLNSQTQRQAAVLTGSSHPNIVRVLDQCEFTYGDKPYLVLVEECFNMTLEDEISRRRATRHFLRQRPMSLAKGLVDALACLQEQGVAHRNITPDNIFVVKPAPERPDEIVLKLGNFWWMRENVPDEEDLHTPTGASIFSSPLVIEAHQRRASHVWHNAFKSDTFSLGSVLKLLSPFVPRDPEFTELVELMTTQDEESRPTFVTLREKFFPEESRVNSSPEVGGGQEESRLLPYSSRWPSVKAPSIASPEETNSRERMSDSHRTDIIAQDSCSHKVSKWLSSFCGCNQQSR